MSNIYFVRHGQSEANLHHIAAGSSDSPLSEEGVKQAHAEAKLIIENGMQFDQIIASPLSRAYDTACIIAQGIGYDVDNIVISELLCERFLGTFQDNAVVDFRSASEEEREAAGCEKLIDLYERVKRANDFVLTHASGNTLVVGHSGFYRMARCVAENLSPEITYTLQQPKNSSLLRYPLSEESPN